MAAERTPDPPDGDSRYLSVAQVARHLGCSVSLVQKWRRLGWITATRLGPPEVPVYGYLPGDVEHFVSQRWNRRRGRPPGSNPLTRAHAPQPPRRTPEAAPTPVSTAKKDPEAAHAAPATWVVPAASLAPLPVHEIHNGTATAAGPGAATSAIRPLFLWDGDPRTTRPLILARFAPHELEYALSVAAAWARRYSVMILGEAATAGEETSILATWHNGERLATF